MGEPFSLALLGGAVITEGVRFVFEQASTLIRTARDRHHRARETAIDPRVDAASPPDVEVVAVPANGVLDAPVDPTVDGRLLDQQRHRLIALTGALAPYAAGDADIEPDDPVLLGALADLRSMLEALYGQRLTLRGEPREPSGTLVDVRQVLGTVRGGVVGVEADSAQDATVRVEQSAQSVEAGGSIMGARIGSIGGRRPDERD
jgi:hypothetical protein